MDNKTNSPGSEASIRSSGEIPRKSKRPARLTLEMFHASWQHVLASEKDPAPKLRSLVRAGFEGDVKSEHVSQMIASLADHGAIADRIALRLAVQERFGKLNQLARRFL